MSLVTYIEPVSIGDFFAGLGAMAFALVLAYCLYMTFQYVWEMFKISNEKDMKYMLFETAMLDRKASESKIDLSAMYESRRFKEEVMQSTKFRKKIEKQLLDQIKTK